MTFWKVGVPLEIKSEDCDLNVFSTLASRNVVWEQLYVSAPSGSLFEM